MKASGTASRQIEFRNRSLDLTIALLRIAEPAPLADELHKMFGGMPGFFNGDATVLDFECVAELPERVDWSGLKSLFRRFKIQLVGVCNLPEAFHAGARQAGLALMDSQMSGSPASQPVRSTVQAAADSTATTPKTPPPQPSVAASSSNNGSLLIHRPMRSGQQIYAKGADAILMAGLSNGAEIIADGNIHCYGPLRGRVIAGASNNRNSRIFTSNFGPELVSIAGIYRTFENGFPPEIAGAAVQIFLDGPKESAKLRIEPLRLD